MTFVNSTKRSLEMNKLWNTASSHGAFGTRAKGWSTMEFIECAYTRAWLWEQMSVCSAGGLWCGVAWRVGMNRSGTCAGYRIFA